MRRPTLALLLGCLLLVAGASALDGYDYYQTIEYAACDQEVYQQDIIIHRSAGTAYNETSGGLEIWHIYVGDHCREDYGDIRFTNSTGAELAYYLWPDYDATSARFAVRLEGADAAGTLAIWYGNPSATTTSDGGTTYEFFDHFDGTAIDSGKWVCWLSGGSQSVSNSAFAISSGSTTWYGWGTKAKWNHPYNIRLEMRVKVSSDSDYWNVGFDDRVNGAVGGIDYARLGAESGLMWQTGRESTNTKVTRSSSDSFSDWAVARIDLTGDSVKFYRNSTLKATITTNLPRDPLSVEMVVRGRTVYTDYVTVRAYSATPPAALTFSGEQEIVCLQPFPGLSRRPTDINSDGLYEDINGNARWDFQDITLFFQHLAWCEANQPVSLFDWNSNGRCDFDDVFRLWSNGGMI